MTSCVWLTVSLRFTVPGFADAEVEEAANVAANAAQATADDNAEKIDRMFERSMYK